MLRTSIKVYLNTLATVHTHHLRVPTHFTDQNMLSSLHLQKGKLSDQGEETELSSIVSIMFGRATYAIENVLSLSDVEMLRNDT